uniref:Uncharacterized protein n=1 Tax=Anguilla anguilla TaxID=7936 RepID=A0A0E9R3H2_ANGAN
MARSCVPFVLCISLFCKVVTEGCGRLCCCASYECSVFNNTLPEYV